MSRENRGCFTVLYPVCISRFQSANEWLYKNICEHVKKISNKKTLVLELGRNTTLTPMKLFGAWDAFIHFVFYAQYECVSSQYCMFLTG